MSKLVSTSSTGYKTDVPNEATLECLIPVVLNIFKSETHFEGYYTVRDP